MLYTPAFTCIYQRLHISPTPHLTLSLSSYLLNQSTWTDRCGNSQTILFHTTSRRALHGLCVLHHLLTETCSGWPTSNIFISCTDSLWDIVTVTKEWWVLPSVKKRSIITLTIQDGMEIYYFHVYLNPQRCVACVGYAIQLSLHDGLTNRLAVCILPEAM